MANTNSHPVLSRRAFKKGRIMDSDFVLVRIAVCGSDAEAHLVRGLLNDAGVPAYVSSEQSALTGLSAVLPTEVLVRQIDVEAATPIVDAYQNSEQPEKMPAWDCKCGEKIDEGFAACWSCGRNFEPATESR